MANSILSAIAASQNLKLTDILKGPVSLSGLSIMDVSIKFPGKLFKNQKEDGGFIVDGKIRNPITIEISCIVQTEDAADRINTILKDRETMYTIVSRGVTINNLLCSNEQIEFSSEMLSAAPFNLTFKEFMLQELSQPITKQDADSTIIDKGIAYLKQTKDSVETYFSNITSGLF